MQKQLRSEKKVWEYECSLMNVTRKRGEGNSPYNVMSLDQSLYVGGVQHELRCMPCLTR